MSVCVCVFVCVRLCMCVSLCECLICRQHKKRFDINPPFLGEMQRIAFRLMLSSCVCMCLCVCVSVCMLRLWMPEKRFEIESSIYFKLRGTIPDIKS